MFVVFMFDRRIMLVKVVVEFFMVMDDFLEDSLDNDLDREVEFVDRLFLISIML